MVTNQIFRIVLIISLFISITVSAQQSSVDSLEYTPPTQLKLSGPRFGFTYIVGALADTLKDTFDANPFITQFGWQFEWMFMAAENDLAGIMEIVPLIGGVEQGLFLPSLSCLVGLRTAKGTEFGVGPNVSLSGAALVFAGGVTKRYGSLNFPINLSVVLSKGSARLSLLSGFNMVSQKKDQKEKKPNYNEKKNKFKWWHIPVILLVILSLDEEQWN